MKIEITTRELPDTEFLEIKVRIDETPPRVLRGIVKDDDQVEAGIYKWLGNVFSTWNDKKNPIDRINTANAQLKMANWEIDNPGNGSHFIKVVGLSDEDVAAIRKSRDIQSK